jgi:hypothetical protein
MLPRGKISFAPVLMTSRFDADCMRTEDKGFVGYSAMAFSFDGASLITVDMMPTSKLTLWDWRLEDGKKDKS